MECESKVLESDRCAQWEFLKRLPSHIEWIREDCWHIRSGKGRDRHRKHFSVNELRGIHLRRAEDKVACVPSKCDP
jgi:hypothetical protein